MKKYQCIKQVLAKPMLASEAIIHSYEVHHHEGTGYELEYPDGYKSWSPAMAFDKGYKCIETYKDRLRLEHEELSKRYIKLKTFVHSDTFKNLQQYDKILLTEQLEVMDKYMKILYDRILITFSNELPKGF